VLITFEVRPLDSRAMEAWQMGKFPLSPAQAHALYFCSLAVGVVLAYTHPAYNSLVLIFGFPVTCVAALVALRMLTGWRYRRASGLVEGQHSMHFSVAGIHHVGPLGVHRYPWTALRGVHVTVWYVLFRFSGLGSVAVPVSALTEFGQSYDEAFLSELAPMIQAAREGSSSSAAEP
jgi:hypothetical protein